MRVYKVRYEYTGSLGDACQTTTIVFAHSAERARKLVAERGTTTYIFTVEDFDAEMVVPAAALDMMPV